MQYLGRSIPFLGCALPSCWCHKALLARSSYRKTVVFVTTGVVEKFPVGSEHFESNIWEVFLAAAVPCSTLRLDCERYSMLMLDKSIGKKFSYSWRRFIERLLCSLRLWSDRQVSCWQRTHKVQYLVSFAFLH